MKAVLAELEVAGAALEGGEAASAWAHSWSTEAAKVAARVEPEKASTPRRKLKEALQMDGACCCCCRSAGSSRRADSKAGRCRGASPRGWRGVGVGETRQVGWLTLLNCVS